MTDEIKDSTKIVAYSLKNSAPDQWLIRLQEALDAAERAGAEAARAEWAEETARLQERG